MDYFDGTYFDETYFDTIVGATTTTIGGGARRATANQIAQTWVVPVVEDVDKEEWITLI